MAGGTYVLGPSAEPESIDLDAESGKVTLKLPCHPRPITASHIISSPDHLPSSLRSNGTGPRKSTAHCIAVLASLPEVLKQARPEGQEEGQEDKDDTAVILFPEEGKEIVRTLMMGEGTGSCPAGQCAFVGSPYTVSLTKDRYRVSQHDHIIHFHLVTHRHPATLLDPPRPLTALRILLPLSPINFFKYRDRRIVTGGRARSV